MTARAQKQKSQRSGDREAAFTLVELLVVLAIIGLIAALVAPQMLRYLGSARVETTQAQLQLLKDGRGFDLPGLLSHEKE